MKKPIKILWLSQKQKDSLNPFIEEIITNIGDAIADEINDLPKEFQGQLSEITYNYILDEIKSRL